MTIHGHHTNDLMRLVWAVVVALALVVCVVSSSSRSEDTDDDASPKSSLLSQLAEPSSSSNLANRLRKRELGDSLVQGTGFKLVQTQLLDSFEKLQSLMQQKNLGTIQMLTISIVEHHIYVVI